MKAKEDTKPLLWLFLFTSLLLLVVVIGRKTTIDNLEKEANNLNRELNNQKLVIEKVIKRYYLEIDSLNYELEKSKELILILNNEVANCHNRTEQSYYEIRRQSNR